MKEMTLYALAERLIGEIEERPGAGSHPCITWAHEMTIGQNQPDEVPWCASWLNLMAWWCRLPRSKSAAARRWIPIGKPLSLHQAVPAANDIVVLKRGEGQQPGPEILDAPGHVGIYMGMEGDKIRVLGGNQNNNVSVALFKQQDILALRRLSVWRPRGRHRRQSHCDAQG
jgi:uncharacterized protein (TIGR02594 family)